MALQRGVTLVILLWGGCVVRVMLFFCTCVFGGAIGSTGYSLRGFDLPALWLTRVEHHH